VHPPRRRFPVAVVVPPVAALPPAVVAKLPALPGWQRCCSDQGNKLLCEDSTR